MVAIMETLARVKMAEVMSMDVMLMVMMSVMVRFSG